VQRENQWQAEERRAGATHRDVQSGAVNRQARWRGWRGGNGIASKRVEGTRQSVAGSGAVWRARGVRWQVNGVCVEEGGEKRMGRRQLARKANVTAGEN